MAIRMIFVGRLDGQAQTEIDHSRTDDIRQRLHAVCDQGERMANEPGCTFEQRENQVKTDAKQRGLQASLDHRFSGLHSGHIRNYRQSIWPTLKVFRSKRFYFSRNRPRTSAQFSRKARSSAPNAFSLWLSMSISPTIFPLARIGTTISERVSIEQARYLGSPQTSSTITVWP